MGTPNSPIRLIKNVQPVMQKGQYVFIALNENPPFPVDDAFCLFREKEGITYVLEKCRADELQLPYSFIAVWITLNVYSSLKAVGLTARVSEALAKENISCNAIAAYHHDHVFVPYRDADRAMAILRKL